MSALLNDRTETLVVFGGNTATSGTVTVPVLQWPELTTDNIRSNIPPRYKPPKIVEKPAPPGKSARRLRIEERWERRDR